MTTIHGSLANRWSATTTVVSKAVAGAAAMAAGAASRRKVRATTAAMVRATTTRTTASEISDRADVSANRATGPAANIQVAAVAVTTAIEAVDGKAARKSNGAIAAR